ncbi:MAG: type II toxin-antitoxin system ParD family antitoxin [Alphaproteobacteria bacterium]|nr:type II toxin-antitoxin system ParD family antitoxin [Alphaproteobacteria bacterium]
METMNISLPDPLKKFVDDQVADGRYSSASEYIRELIRADEKAKAREKLKALLMEGLASPESDLTESDWEAIRGRRTGKRRGQAKRVR